MRTLASVEERFIRRALRQLLADTAYVLVAFPVTLAAYVVCFTLFMVGVSLVVIWVGLPIMVAAHRVAGWFAMFERERTGWVIHRAGSPIQPEHQGAGLLAPLTNGRSWVRLIWTFIAWITSTVAFSVVVSWWATAIGGITYPAWRWALPDGDDDETLNELMGLGDERWVEISLYVAIGIVMLVLLPLAVRVCALMQAWLTRGMLGAPHGSGSPLPPPPPSARPA